MEEQRLAACAEKLKRLNEKHRQTAEGKSSSAQIISDETGAAREEASISAPAPIPSPVPSVAISQSQAPVIQAPLPERVDRDRERMERERERVEPNAEEEVHLPCQPSPPIQRPVVPEPQSEGESTLAEVSPLMEENQADRTAAPIRDYFSIEDSRGKQAESLFCFCFFKYHFSHRSNNIFLSLQWMIPTFLCLTWTPPVVRKSLWLRHSWKERQQRLCVPLSPQVIPNSFKNLCHLVSLDSR